MNTEKVLKSITEIRESAGFSDLELLQDIIQPCDVNVDYITANNNYVWWWAIGRKFRPKRIAEMGTRYGYSLWSLWKGSEHAPHQMDFWVYDDERNGIKTLDTFQSAFRVHGLENVYITREDTQKLTELHPKKSADLVVVDAWHTESGVQHECELALQAARPGGIIVVDDTNPGEVRTGCEKFCKKHGLPFVFLPTYRGVHVIQTHCTRCPGCSGDFNDPVVRVDVIGGVTNTNFHCPQCGFLYCTTSVGMP